MTKLPKIMNITKILSKLHMTDEIKIRQFINNVITLSNDVVELEWRHSEFSDLTNDEYVVFNKKRDALNKLKKDLK